MIARILKLVAIFLAFAFVVGLSAYLTFFFLVKTEKSVIVPDIQGRNVVYGLEILTDLGLNIKVQSSRYDPQTPKHYVISQYPEPGAKIKKGRDIKIVISKGKQRLIMPDFKGLPLEQARMIIEENDLQAAVLAESYSSRHKPGQIMAQYPPAGKMISRGASVDLLISQGARPRAYVMPDLITDSLSTALTRIEALGLQTGNISSRPTSGASKNAVIDQTPPPGERVTTADRVQLVINRSRQAGPDHLLQGQKGVRLFQYRLEKGLLNRHIKVVMNCFGMSLTILDQYMAPDELIWVLVPTHRDATLLLYVNKELVKTKIYSSWETI